MVLLAERERWPEGRYLAVDLQLVTERNDRSAAAKSTARSPASRRVAGARRRRQHLVDRRPRGLGQAHRRCLQGSARGRPAVDRDHRQRGGAPPRGARTRAASRRTRRSRWPTSRCASSTGSCSCSTPKRRPSSGAPGRAPRSTTQGYGLDRLRDLTLTDSDHAAARRPGHTSTSRWRRSSGSWTPDTIRRPVRRQDGEAPGLEFNALRADLFRPRPPRSSTRSVSATRPSSGCCGTCC